VPKVYRSMRSDGESPEVGPSARSLGVRPGQDIPVAYDGSVHPKTGGMSVAPQWRVLRAHRIPKRLQSICEKATGSDDDRIWTMGTGEFANGIVHDCLELSCDSIHHGVIGPNAVMHIEELQAQLAKTRHLWAIDED
jgi:hypothetical protein